MPYASPQVPLQPFWGYFHGPPRWYNLSFFLVHRCRHLDVSYDLRPSVKEDPATMYKENIKIFLVHPTLYFNFRGVPTPSIFPAVSPSSSRCLLRSPAFSEGRSGWNMLCTISYYMYASWKNGPTYTFGRPIDGTCVVRFMHGLSLPEVFRY